jgi:phage tail-like protein
MPSFEPNDTAVGYAFFAEFDGPPSMLMEVGPLTSEVKVIDIKHQLATGQYSTKKVPAKPEGGQLTMKRGLTDNTDWKDWHKLAADGKAKDMRKTGSIVVLTYSAEEIARWNVEAAWISKLEIGVAKAGDTSPLTETATVVFENLVRVK